MAIEKFVLRKFIPRGYNYQHYKFDVYDSKYNDVIEVYEIDFLHINIGKLYGKRETAEKYLEHVKNMKTIYDYLQNNHMVLDKLYRKILEHIDALEQISFDTNLDKKYIYQNYSNILEFFGRKPGMFIYKLEDKLALQFKKIYPMFDPSVSEETPSLTNDIYYNIDMSPNKIWTSDRFQNKGLYIKDYNRAVITVEALEDITCELFCGRKVKPFTIFYKGMKYYKTWCSHSAYNLWDLEGNNYVRESYDHARNNEDGYFAIYDDKGFLRWIRGEDKKRFKIIEDNRRKSRVEVE